MRDVQTKREKNMCRHRLTRLRKDCTRQRQIKIETRRQIRSKINRQFEMRNKMGRRKIFRQRQTTHRSAGNDRPTEDKDRDKSSPKDRKDEELRDGQVKPHRLYGKERTKRDREKQKERERFVQTKKDETT